MRCSCCTLVVAITLCAINYLAMEGILYCNFLNHAFIVCQSLCWCWLNVIVTMNDSTKLTTRQQQQYNLIETWK